jgi:hypothetical protein
VVPGVAVGVAFATAEPLALALAALGLSLLQDRRVVASGLAFAGAALTKESYALVAVAAAAWLIWGAGHRRRERLAEAAAMVVPGVLLLGLWWAYVAWRIPAGPGDSRAADAVGPPLAGWGRALGQLLGGGYAPDAPVGPLGAVMLVGSLVVAVAAIAVGLRRATLLGWTGLLLGVYGLAPPSRCLRTELTTWVGSVVRPSACARYGRHRKANGCCPRRG